MQNTTFVVAALQTERQSTALAVEFHTLGNNLRDTIGALVYQNIYRAIFAQAAACDKCIGFVNLRIVIAGRNDSYTTLSIERITLSQERFGDHRHVALKRRLVRRIQSRKSATYNYVIKFAHYRIK